MADTPPLNSYNPSCVVSQCLRQVVGSIDGNPLAQYSACTSTFGAPVISTLTPSVEVVFSTLVDTVSYTDIVVSTSTTFSVYEAIITMSTDVPDTVTETTSTTTTTTDTVTAATTTVTPIKHKKRGGCKPRTTSSSLSFQFSSTSSFAPESSSLVPNNFSATYSIYPSISTSSSSSGYSFDPSSFSTTTYSSTSDSPSTIPTTSSSVPVIPIASYCSDLEEYSSACACIDAVSTTSIVTAPTPTSTSTILSTVSVSVPSVSVSLVTITVTSDVTTVETSTLTATQTTTDVLTETVTSTYTPTPSPYLKITSSTTTARVGRYITLATCNGNVCLQFDSANTGVSVAGQFAVSDTGVWSLRDQPSLTAYIYTNSGGVISVISFMSSSTAASLGDYALTCSVGDAGAFTCQSSTSMVYDTFVSCGAWIYIIPAARYAAYVGSGCVKIGLSLST
ncbi:uncharacterized protein F4807DRAFT_67144 [Annulohypoxylon truncatum]|uniref:uncharacterized protein n=1 Tax=Annulohypoxylon truncatum TaxID=327061 RepID=UPI0020074D8E|nr:uncharacterized protein F4807DRAFT_67144 [Annulohypoxylon truncatum]KAI1210454.1 hypothetical protein F4807DRAFT_67144 [Annulohypoxylon truncatum]